MSIATTCVGIQKKSEMIHRSLKRVPSEPLEQDLKAIVKTQLNITASRSKASTKPNHASLKWLVQYSNAADTNSGLNKPLPPLPRFSILEALMKQSIDELFTPDEFMTIRLTRNSQNMGIPGADTDLNEHMSGTSGDMMVADYTQIPEVLDEEVEIINSPPSTALALDGDSSNLLLCKDGDGFPTHLQSSQPRVNIPPPPPVNNRRRTNTPHISTSIIEEQVSTEEAQLEPRSWLLPPLRPNHQGRKCLVLDLDETLVHSSFEFLDTADLTIPFNIQGQNQLAYVIKRPGVDCFMKRVGELYEVVVFTASLSNYGDPLLDQFDIHHVVHHRLFRESCCNYNDYYVKDLSQIGRDLCGTIIIDNSPTSYEFHFQNAVPVTSWFGDTSDNELLDLIPLLEELADDKVKDVRPKLTQSMSQRTKISRQFYDKLKS